MIFEQLNPHACKTYLIVNDNTNDALLIDPVIDHFNDYLELIKERNLRLTHVIDTHTHADHISAGSSLKDATDCEYVMHKNAPPKCVTKRVDDGDVLDINGFKINVLHTPGHTKDSVSLILDDKFFTGDFLFLDDGGAGRDDLPGGDPFEHWESLQKLESIPDSLTVYPAHEYRDRKPSSLGNQRKTNPHLKKMSKEDFAKYLDDLRLGAADWMKDVLKANYACAKDPKAAWIPVDSPACEIKGTMEKGVNDLDVGHISAKELKEKLDSDNANLVLLDVREKYELNGELGHIEGTLNIPVGLLSSKLDTLEKHKNDEIVVICRSGGRATTAAQTLKKADFKDASVLEGGMIKWKSMF